MIRFFTRFRTRTAQPANNVSFCDACVEVCTPDCRRAALQASRDRILLNAGMRQF